jgi:hypothetical protein
VVLSCFYLVVQSNTRITRYSGVTQVPLGRYSVFLGGTLTRMGWSSRFVGSLSFTFFLFFYLLQVCNTHSSIFLMLQRFDLRKDIQLNTSVLSAHFHEVESSSFCNLQHIFKGFKRVGNKNRYEQVCLCIVLSWPQVCQRDFIFHGL